MDPTKEPQYPEPDFKIISVKWDYVNHELDCYYRIYGRNFDISIHVDDREFEEFLPKDPPEYNFMHGGDDYMAVLIDDLNCMHWLIKDFKGQVYHRMIFMEPILEKIAFDKFHDPYSNL